MHMAIDLRLALRLLRRGPAFAAVAVLSLALGIGANTALFSVIDALMLRPLPVADAANLWSFTTGDDGADWAMTAYPLLLQYRERLPSLMEVAGSTQFSRSNIVIDGSGDLRGIGEPAVRSDGQRGASGEPVAADATAAGAARSSAGRGTPDPDPVKIGLVSGNYFALLGLEAALGRTLTTDDDRAPGAHPVAVISARYWARRFSAAPDVIGRTFTLHDTTYTIVGVTPRGFTGDTVGSPTDLWVPFAMAGQIMPERGGLLATDLSANLLQVHVLARMQPGVQASQAAAAATVVWQEARRAQWRARNGSEPVPARMLAPLTLAQASRGFAPRRMAPTLTILMAIVGLVLLVACANVAGLLLARSASRQREIAVRLALGASRGRIARQFMTESLLLAAMGGAVGLLFAQWGTAVLARMLASGLDPLNLGLAPDTRVLLFTLALSLLTGIIFGAAPAVRGAQVAISPALVAHGVAAADSRGSGRARRGSASSAGSASRARSASGAGSAGGADGISDTRGFGAVSDVLSRLPFFGSRGLRLSPGHAIVITQIALSLVLLVVAGLFLRSLRNLATQDLGYERAHTLLVWVAPGRGGRDEAASARMLQGMQARLAALPGVVSASSSATGLLNSDPYWVEDSAQLTIAGRPRRAGQRWISSRVGQRFFDTIGMPRLLGRDFTERDITGAAPVAIVNETLARFYFGEENPVGHHLTYAGWTGAVEIVGVVRDAKYISPRDKGLGMIYLPQGTDKVSGEFCVALRAAGDPALLVPAVRQALLDFDPTLPVLDIATIDQQLRLVIAQDRMVATLSTAFAALALALACVGLYGAIAFTVARRLPEMGIRLALGATRAGILRLVLGDSARLTLTGIIIGLPAALLSTRAIASRLFGVAPADPATLTAAIVLLIAVALGAALIPARRAARVDPMTTLRCE